MGKIIDELTETKDITLQAILNNLLDGKHDLDLKTHIYKPKQLAVLFIFADYLEKIGLTYSSEVIKSFLDKYERYMVSYNRMGRKEIIKALTHMIEEEQEKLSTTKKLTMSKV